MMIRKAAPADMTDILEVYQSAREYMQRNGNKQQWGNSYPPVDMLESDIEAGHLYVVVEDGALHGVFAFIMGEDPTYRTIVDGAWTNQEPYGTIHRIASDGKIRGVFDRCLDFCKALCGNIRIDTHHDNKTMQHLIEKNGFDKCGIVYMDDGSPRIAYQYSKGTL